MVFQMILAGQGMLNDILRIAVELPGAVFKSTLQLPFSVTFTGGVRKIGIQVDFVSWCLRKIDRKMLLPHLL